MKRKKRKTTNHKIAAQIRYQENIKRLEKLKRQRKDLEDLQEKSEQEKRKLKRVKNLKIFKSALNLISPALLVSAITPGISYITGAGYPIIIDDVAKEKIIHCKYDENPLLIEEHYERRTKDLPDNILEITTPYQEEDGVFVRYLRTYSIDHTLNDELLEEIEKKDFEKISKSLHFQTEIKQTTTEKKDTTDNSYQVKLDIYMKDKNDLIKFQESDKRNQLANIISFIFLTISSYAIIKFREYDITGQIDRINQTYKINLIAVIDYQKDIEQINKKIHTLEKNLGGKYREKL